MTILYVSHEFGAVESHVDRLVLVSGGISYDGPPEDLPGLWHDPSHSHAHDHKHAEDSSLEEDEV
jgi:ABC-type Mn2+/Zn2+ transport system ATPase subunit